MPRSTRCCTTCPTWSTPTRWARPSSAGRTRRGPNNGQNVFWGGTVPRATINLDGHYLNYNEMFFGATSVWDVESIEVFRGPQTTSQGANAIAGAIVVNTKDPSFKREGAYQLEAGDYHSRRASIAVSGPVGEELAARLAVDYSGRDTFIDYTNPQFQRGQGRSGFPRAERTREVPVAAQQRSRPGGQVHLFPQRQQPPQPGGSVRSVQRAGALDHDHAQLEAEDRHRHPRPQLRAGQRRAAGQPVPVFALVRAALHGHPRRGRCRYPPEQCLQ